MDLLLKRQIRKYLSKDFAESKDLQPFLEAINKSYKNFNEQNAMQQRGISIGSEELFQANQQLREEAKSQKKVIAKLKRVIETLKFYGLPDNKSADNIDLDGVKLVEFIDNQTKEIIKINTQREKLLSDLEHQNQELSDYAHMVSHDLKSPLRNIHVLATWLKEDFNDKLGDNGNDSIDLIKNNVEKMETLINGILDYSTINSDEAELYEVNIDKIVDDIIDMVKLSSKVDVFKSSDLPMIKGNKYRLQQLFQNLIDNAIKYNDKDNGKVEVGFEDKDDLWQFYVKDNGKGIDEKYFDKIFMTFQKLENTPESSGIGLSVVKKIISRYGGTIWVESEINVGTTFYFTLKK